MSNNFTYREIADRILDLIRSEIYPPGSQLPKQRDLAETLGVNRVKIREACIALEVMGFIKLKSYRGAYVVDSGLTPLTGPPKVSPLELTEARALFEAESAALAAPIITDEAIFKLRHYVSIMSGAKDEAITPDDADEAFHTTIARSTNNQMIIYVIVSMWKIRKENTELRRVYDSVCKRDSTHREHEHLDILQALEKRDPIAARKAMRAHFTTIIEELLKVSEVKAYQEIQLKASQVRSRFLLSNQIHH